MSLSKSSREVVDHHEETHDNDVGVAVQLAHDVDQERPSPWTFSMFRLYAVLGVAYLCGCLVWLSLSFQLT